ncbi:MAG TPA: T9SS type A sorting domain-containing protein [Ignavibacteriaceae bacterium]|nr:T9SS type A sorting domain-containing protein [Ignavibacteriaceae bacterium]
MGKLFSIIYIIYICTFVGVFSEEIFSQPNYRMKVSNGVKVNNNTIEFDVFIKSISSDFILTSYQCTFYFTQSILNNGNINFSFISGTSQFLKIPPAVSIGIHNNNGSYILTFASIPSQVADEEIISSSYEKIGRFRLTNSNSFIGDDFNILWCFNGNAPTILTGSGFSNITKGINHINLFGATTFPLSVSIENGWNLVSIPGFQITNQHVNTWWANRDLNANVFNGLYQVVTNLEPGTGYWMKHNGDITYNTGDEWPSEGMFYSPNNPIVGRAGWNLIGIYNYNLSVAGITTTPPGLQNGFVYGFSRSSGYSPSNSLAPGNGYLIYLTSAGRINLPDSGFAGMPKVNEFIKEDWGIITITDNAGRSYKLYTVNDESNLEDFHLPPVPPDELFDVRFSSGKFVENINRGIHSIEMNGIEYPIKIKVENKKIRFQDETGLGINTSLEAGEEIKISFAAKKLFVSENIVPSQYSLEQNYPNPFNPGTTIRFSIPEEVSNVKLTIYDALGQKITELVNATLEPGNYNYYWDAFNSASGLYIYELRAESTKGGFISTKKMLLLK